MSASAIVPPRPPRVQRAMVDAWILGLPEPEASRALTYVGGIGPVIVGRRGYYRDAMGDAGVNERGIYDDAIVVMGLGALEAFNANTDPSLERPGIATLAPGVWHYRLGIHGLSKPREKQYEALVQAAPVTVRRDPVTPLTPPVVETGWFGVNIHRGGEHETLSAGCQTLYKPQYSTFLALVKDLMAEAGATSIPYVLTARADAAGEGSVAA